MLIFPSLLKVMRKIYLGLIVLALIPLNSFAVIATVTNTFTAGQKIVASQINTNYNDILSAINGLLSSENILDGSIATADLADLLITTAKLATGSVTTAKIASGGVTNIKLASYNFATTSAVSYLNTGITETPIASTSITGVGRPIMVSTINSQGKSCFPANPSDTFSEQNVATGNKGFVSIRKNSATVSVTYLPQDVPFSCSTIANYLDSAPNAGTITYEIRGRSAGGGTSISICNCALFVREL